MAGAAPQGCNGVTVSPTSVSRPSFAREVPFGETKGEELEKREV